MPSPIVNEGASLLALDRPQPVPLDFLIGGDPAATIISLDERVFRRGELIELVLAARRAWASLRLAPGDVVAWVGQTTIEAIVAELAVSSLDLVWAPLGSRLTVFELVERLHRLSPGAVLYDARSGDRAIEMTARTLEAIETHGQDLIAIGCGPQAEGLAFSSFIEIGTALRGDPPVCRHRHLNRIQFTSGTESTPKAVGLSSAALMGNARSMAASMRLTEEDRFFSPLPLDHAAGYCTLLTTLGSGGLCMLQRYFDAEAAIAQMKRLSCTALRGVDATYADLVDASGSNPPRIRSGILSTTNREIRGRITDAFGFDEGVQVYGMTESSGPATLSRSDESFEERLETHGAPVATMEIRIDGSQHEGQGEIFLRGQRMMLGYLGDTAATARSCEGGWFATGDRGELVEGRLRYLGRIKDVIRVGGENVACAEIESVLAAFPGVRQAAAFPLPHERLGDVVGAAIVTSDPSFDVDGLRAHTAGRLARFKVPREFHVVDHLPLTAAGKVRRRDLTRAFTARSNEEKT
jgi:acyl-CoA synthetase (AMP-forming)/AMP-acid ligase II